MEFLNEVTTFFKTSLTTEMLSLLISLASFSFSVYVMYKSRKKVTVTWSEDLRVLSDGKVFIHSCDGNHGAYGPGLLLTIDIVNPSPSDIAYFDLRAFDAKANRNTYLLTRKALHPQHKDSRIYCDNGNYEFELDIPEKQYGILKANSFTKFDIFIIPNEHIGDTLTINFKIAVNSYFSRDRFSVTNRKKYKSFVHHYDITGWEQLTKLETPLD